MGESGSGKTTLARLLLGATDPTEGAVLYKGKDLRKLSKSESPRFLHDVQVIFQDPFEVYNPFYQVEHVLTMPIDYLKLASSEEREVGHGRGGAGDGRACVRMRRSAAIPTS